jgi:hypothetical protein
MFLERALPYVLVLQRQAVLDLLIHDLRDEYSARLGQPLESHCDIDSLTMDLLALYYDLSQIDPDAKLDPARDRQFSIADSQLVLDLDRTLHSLHHARKLCQQAIPSRADCTAAMVLDQNIHPLEVGA